VVQYSRPASLPRVRAPPGAAPILVLPGFGNAATDYTAPFGVEEASLAAALTSRGYSVHVLPMERKDWFSVAGGLFSPKFYSGTCTTDEGYGWYLRRVDDELRRVREATGCERVALCGHSAGGWLARAYVGDARYGASDGCPAPGIAAVLSLGTPHLPPPPGVFDVTRGALSWLNDRLPGSAFAAQGVRYVSVAGRTVRARATAEAGPVKYATTSYGALLGQAEGVIGDAVVPLDCALLDGATQLVLDGVWHSMSKVGTFDEASNVVWYGSDAVVDWWLPALHAEQA
jgi:pimeloyl-ACP methyl ester carboxylesterase